MPPVLAALGLGGGAAAGAGAAGAGAGAGAAGASAAGLGAAGGAGAGLSSALYGAGASLPAAAGGAGVAAFPASLATPSLFSQLTSSLGGGLSTLGTNFGRGLIGEQPNAPGFLPGLGNFAGRQALAPTPGQAQQPQQQQGPSPHDLYLLMQMLRGQQGGFGQ